MRKKLTFFIFILILFVSGCLKEYGSVYLESVDVDYYPKDQGSMFVITPYIHNTKDTETGQLSVRVRIKDESGMILAEKKMDLGYIEGRGNLRSSMSLSTHTTSESMIEVVLFENGKRIDSLQSQVSPPAKEEKPRVKFTQVTLEVSKYAKDNSKAVVKVYPAIYNQGKDVELEVEVAVKEGDYTVYTQSTRLGKVKAFEHVKGSLHFILPRDKLYIFTLTLKSKGESITQGWIDEEINLNKLKWNTLLSYPVMEAGKPRTEERRFKITPIPRPKTSGFTMLSGIVIILAVFLLKRRW